MNGPDSIQIIPLDKLVKSPRNHRRTPPSEAEFKASITVRGLQQNLFVAPANGDAEPDSDTEGEAVPAILTADSSPADTEASEA